MGGTANDLGYRLEQLDIPLYRRALLLVMQGFVCCLERRLAVQSYHVQVWQVILPWSGTLRCRHLVPRHVPRSFMSLNRKDGAIFHILIRSKRYLSLVPALLRLVEVKVIGAWARFVRLRSSKLFINERVLRFSTLLIFHIVDEY